MLGLRFTMLPGKGTEACSVFLSHVAGSWQRSLMILVCLGVGHVGRASAAPRDTITVDGAPLELELDILEVDPVMPSEEGRKRIKGWGGQGPDVLVTACGALAMHPGNATGEGVSAYMGRGVRPGLCMGGVLEWKGKQRFLRVEAEIGRSTEWTFDAAALKDTLFGVAPDGAGGLEQWVYTTYDIGIEIDTFPLPTALRPLSVGGLGVSLGGYWGGAGRGRTQASGLWWAGFKGTWIASGREATEVNRMAAGGVPSPAAIVGDARNDWEAVSHFAWGLGAGASSPLGRAGWSWLVKGQWAAGPIPRWALQAGLQFRFR